MYCVQGSIRPLQVGDRQVGSVSLTARLAEAAVGLGSDRSFSPLRRFIERLDDMLIGSYVRWKNLRLLRSYALARKIMLLTVTAVPVKKGCRSAGSEKDEVSFEAFLVDDSSALERGEN
jgi:hypothetical protein